MVAGRPSRLPDGLALVVRSGTVLNVPGDFESIQCAAQLGKLLFVRLEEVLHLAPLSAEAEGAEAEQSQLRQRKSSTGRASRAERAEGEPITDRVSRVSTGRACTERGGTCDCEACSCGDCSVREMPLQLNEWFKGAIGGVFWPRPLKQFDVEMKANKFDQ